jgi:predicted NAD/FAD-dependent oxidoreductase
VHDAVIVGAGLAGLAAAFELKDYDIRVLERDDRPGGRVETVRRDGVVYDIGAVSGARGRALPFRKPGPERLREPAAFGVLLGEELSVCGEVSSCLAELQSSGRAGADIDLTGAFFNVFHAGEISRYDPARRGDAALVLPRGRYVRGNRVIVDRYLEGIGDRLTLGAEVIRVDDRGDAVEVRYRRKGEELVVRARAAIVATPAPVAARILARADPATRRFLESVRYGRFTVVALGLAGVPAPEIDYAVTPDRASSAVIFRRDPTRDTVVALVYYGDVASRRWDGSSDADVIGDARETVRRVLPFDPAAERLADIRRWERGSTIISRESYGAYDPRFARPSGRVALAGDYLPPADGIPYGMLAAVEAGRRAADDVLEHIRPGCYSVDGIYLTKIPTPEVVAHVSRIRPPVFGLVGGGEESVAWINEVDEARFGYDFERLYGHKDFDTIIGIEAKNLDVIGYCPYGEEVSAEQFARRIAALKERFPGKRILIGPCVDLFPRVLESQARPHLLGFELFEKDFDGYLRGEYDELIARTLAGRTDVYNFPTFGDRVNLARLRRVMDRATLRGLKLGYTISGGKRVLDFLESTQCREKKR